MNMKTSIRISALGISLFLIAGSILAQTDSLPPINDGPYVIWTEPHKAEVLYICNDSLIEREYTDVDTLHIRAGCDDSAPMLDIPATLSAVKPDSFPNVTKFFAVSDIHGEYEALVQLLRKAGVIDSALAWSWGKGHLVVVGDVGDRGDKVTEVYWLIYRLEQEAQRVGGDVHFVIGNHDKMDLRGESRDVNEVYSRGVVLKSRLTLRDLLGPDTELGQWLRTRNAIIKLNTVIFVHGGLSPQLAERGWSITEINRRVREYLELRGTQVEFSDEPKFLTSVLGPLWYRGFFRSVEGKYNQLTEPEVRQVLLNFGASAVVVGHSQHEHIDGYFGGLVWGADNIVAGPEMMEGLLWQDDHYYRVSGDGSRVQLQ